MQLRDAHTSELIAEGSPLEVALLALELGPDEVLFDGAGDTFDPDAVIAHHRERLEGLQGAARDRGLPDDHRKDLQRAVKAAQAELELDAGQVKAATAELEAARARLDA